MIFNFATFVTIIGTAMSFGYVTQCYKIIKTKSVEGVSLITYLIFAFGLSTWLIYGISLEDTPIIISNSVALLGASAVICLYLIYSKRSRKREIKI